MMTTQGSSYRLLYSAVSPVGGLRAIAYYVSVDRFQDREHIEELICHVFRNEKLPPSDMVSVAIYHKLDAYRPMGGLPQPNLRDHDLAYYTWNISPEVPDRITAVRDLKGNLIDPPQRYDFEHVKACNQSRE